MAKTQKSKGPKKIEEAADEKMRNTRRSEAFSFSAGRQIGRVNYPVDCSLFRLVRRANRQAS